MKREIGTATLYLGDCRDLLPTIEADCVVTDPPYGVTSLDWDATVSGWTELVRARSLWCFGSMRFFMGQQFLGWTYAQEIVWEKHNGSIFHADRFRRVHELALHFYRGDWASLYKSPVMRWTLRRAPLAGRQRPAHSGHIDGAHYASEDGGPRMERSVIYARSCHGSAVHPTQKPVEILQPLVEYSCPPNGLVLDPFGGSFSTGVACHQAGRRFVGIEIDPERFDIGCRNLEDSLRQVKLFA
jgi:site-specific DNA-methyltransferase (adenine-specific)